MYLKGICLRKIVSLLRRSKTGQLMALPPAARAVPAGSVKTILSIGASAPIV